MEIFVNFFKQIVLVSTVLFSQVCFASICVNKSTNLEMKAGVLAHGHELAFQDSNFYDYQLFSANNDAEFAAWIQKNTPGACSLVLGLFTSRECLIAGPILMENKTIGISFICGHDDVAKFFPYIYTATPPISKAERFITDYLNKQPNLGKVFAVYQPTDIYSEGEFSQFKKMFAKPVEEVQVQSDGKFDISKISYRKGEPITFVFFVYPLPSVKILVELSNHQLITKDTNIVGASSWSDDIAMLKPIKLILEKANKVIALDVLDWKKIKDSAFAKKFITLYNRNPTNVEILEYDITKFAVKCYRQSFVNKKYNINLFRGCMLRNKYHGISGTFSFSEKSPFAERRLYLINLLDLM